MSDFGLVGVVKPVPPPTVFNAQIGKTGLVMVAMPANVVVSGAVQTDDGVFQAESPSALSVGQIVTVINVIGGTDVLLVGLAAETVTNIVSVNVTNNVLSVSQSGAWNVAVSGNVSITNSTIAVTQSGTWSVTVSNTITVSGTVAFSNSTIGVTQSGAWNMVVSGSVSISAGTITITNSSFAITGTVTIAGTVTITSGAVTISTAAGTNILIDLLAQGAYTERRVTIANDNGVVAPNTPPSNFNNYTLCNKFFPRGCRGVLYSLEVYCNRTSTGILVMRISPYPGSGAIITATVTPGANWGWASVNIYRMWNYDSMFIWCTEMDADVSAGYDGTTPSDAYALDATGNVIGQNAVRIYIRAYMMGQTVGDVPVSGTVNNIEIPNSSTSINANGVTCPAGSPGAVTNILSVFGSGKLVYLTIDTSIPICALSFIIDGVAFPAYNIIAGNGLSPALLNALGYNATTPNIQLIKYTAGDECFVAISIPIEFKQSFVLTGYAGANAVVVTAAGLFNLIS